MSQPATAPEMSTAKKKKRPKKSPPKVELGFAEPLEGSEAEAASNAPLTDYHLQSQFFPSKIGGRPSWLALDPLPDPSDLHCLSCKRPCDFLMQIYAPVQTVEDAFHRTLFVFICLDPECYQPNSSHPILVLRSQLARSNSFYGYEPLDPDFWDPNTDGAGIKTAWDFTTLCFVCGCKGTLRCGRCPVPVWYCSKEHQEFHWKRGHKIVCQRKKKAGPEESSICSDLASAGDSSILHPEMSLDSVSAPTSPTVSINASLVNESPPALKTVRLYEHKAFEVGGTICKQTSLAEAASTDQAIAPHVSVSDDSILSSEETATKREQTEMQNHLDPGIALHNREPLRAPPVCSRWDRSDGNIFLFPEMEVVTETEVYRPASKNGSKDDGSEVERPEEQRLADYEKYIKEHKGAGVACTKDNLDALEELSVKQDKAFKEFTRRVSANPEQVLRYERGGAPLLANVRSGAGDSEALTVPSKAIRKDQEQKKQEKTQKLPLLDGIDTPSCENCGSQRIFEFQIMPHLLSLMGVDAIGRSIDWATVLVFTCEDSCSPPTGGKAYLREFVAKQDFE